MDTRGAALVQRIDAQGWDQGCMVPFRDWVFIASVDVPTSTLGAQVASAQGLREGSFVAHATPDQQVGAIVTTQVCDLVADVEVEPFCEAMPLVRLPAGQALPQANSTRWFLVAAEQRLVVDGSYRLQFEKSLLPDERAHQLLDDSRSRLFAAWLARRSCRAAFPNDFVASVGRAVGWAWGKKRFADDPSARAFYQWRVGIYGENEDHVDFLLPYDERAIEGEAAARFAADFFAAVRRRLPVETAKAREYERTHGSGEAIRDYTIGATVARSARQVTMRQMLEMPPFNLEHLTYRAETIVGAESRLEWEG